ncbi:MAG: hypothetical protein IKR27_06835 [Lachnospiraceae bacterium]|nr:hypothetical protein [Lachnospiraceae bacterium]MBR6274700.1 hypothetical protein [Lachnospiraceae bacterium]
MKKSELKDFVTALRLLDEKIGANNSKNITIRAIGGFAMLYYDFRKNGYTIDIDSLTEKYDQKTIELIREVGLENDLDEEWLNTDCSLLEGFLRDLGDKINWKETEYHFKHIDLRVADIAGLIRSKAKAIHDGGLVPRTTDKKDLLSGLIHIGIKNIEELDANQEYAFIKADYCRCYAFLTEIEKWG